MEIKELLRRMQRVILVSRKPTNDEFLEVAKVTGIGILLFGTIGLVIHIIFSLF